MKFGVFSVSMPEYTPEETVKLLKEIGYDAVEWRVTDLPPAEGEEHPMAAQFGEMSDEQRYAYRYWIDNKSTIDSHNVMEATTEATKFTNETDLETFALSSYYNTDQYDELIDVYKAAEANNIPAVRVGLVTYDFDKEEKTVPELNQKMRSELERLVDLSKETGVKTLIEIHHGTLISGFSAAYNMLRGLNPQYIGCIVDPGNMVAEGYEDYRKGFELLGDFVAHVHMKNGRYVEKDERDALGAKQWEFVWTPLKEGQANLLRVFQVMKAVGYDGSVSLEDFSNEATTEEKLRENLEFMKKAKNLADKA
jgi:sugar phosphate isomerase/epimerase